MNCLSPKARRYPPASLGLPPGQRAGATARKAVGLPRPVPSGPVNTLNRHHAEGDRALKGDARRNLKTEPGHEAIPDGL